MPRDSIFPRRSDRKRKTRPPEAPLIRSQKQTPEINGLNGGGAESKAKMPINFFADML